MLEVESKKRKKKINLYWGISILFIIIIFLGNLSLISIETKNLISFKGINLILYNCYKTKETREKYKRKNLVNSNVYYIENQCPIFIGFK